MRRTIGTLASGLALVAALSACGGDPEPQFEAEPSVTPSAASPSASAEAEPWEERTDEGAVAFVEHWIGEFNAMQTSGQTDAFAALGVADCQTCENFVDITNQIYSDGSRIESNGWSITGVGVPPNQDGNTRDVSVSIRQAPEVIYAPNGEVDRKPGGRITVVATVLWRQDSWRMAELSFPS